MEQLWSGQWGIPAWVDFVFVGWLLGVVTALWVTGYGRDRPTKLPRERHPERPSGKLD